LRRFIASSDSFFQTNLSNSAKEDNGIDENASIPKAILDIEEEIGHAAPPTRR
jgi:hypothetical protein